MAVNISDDDLKSLNEYAADSLLSAPPPFKTISGDLLLMMTAELIRRRAADKPALTAGPYDNEIDSR